MKDSEGWRTILGHMAADRGRFRNYVFLAPLFAIAVFYQVRYIDEAIDAELHGTEQCVAGFSAGARGIVRAPRKETIAAGLHAGDRILSVNGREWTGSLPLVEEVDKLRPGQTLALEILPRNGGARRSIEVPAIPRRTSPPTTLDWVVRGFLIGAQIFCLVLGFYVAAIRPSDRMAWIVLGLMIGFASLVMQVDVRWMGGPFYRTVMTAYHALAVGTWPIFLLLFGLYFPMRLRWERSRRWFQWIWLAPLLAMTALAVIVQTGSYTNYAAIQELSRIYESLIVPSRVLTITAVGLFLMLLIWKGRTIPDPDARRRLNLVKWGASVGLTPMLLLAVRGAVTGRSLFAGLPEYVTIPAVSLLFLLPATLAYVIVVHRALDVRVVVRQGVQYALARGGVRVLQVSLTALALFAAVSLAFDPEVNRPRRLQVLALGAISAALIRRLSVRVLKWTDRRFFREAYNVEHVLEELSDSVRTMVEQGPLIETVTRRMSETLHVPRVATLLRDNGFYRPAFALGYDAPPTVEFDTRAGTVERLRQAKEPPRVYFDDDRSWVHEAAAGEAQALRTLDSQLLLPLTVKDSLLGFVSLGPKQSEEPYSRSDVRLLQSVAAQTGLALENSRLTAAIAHEVAQKERLNREIEIAREVQERLFPQSRPEVAGLDYWGECRPALGVGGDYFDFLTLPNGGLGLAVGDVSGKGIAAALLMASLQASLRSQTIEQRGDAARVVRNINRLIYEATPSNRFATLFYAEYDPRERRLVYVNAGHNAPMLFRCVEGGLTVLRLDEGGTAVGFFRGTEYRQGAVPLQSGDLLVAFTDGLSEAMNAAEEEWGEERLAETARAHRERPPRELIAKLINAADSFVDGAPQSDDMTVVVARVV